MSVGKENSNNGIISNDGNSRKDNIHMKALNVLGGLLVFMGCVVFICTGIIYGIIFYQDHLIASGSRIPALATKVGERQIDTSDGPSSIDLLRFTTRDGQLITATPNSTCNFSFDVSKPHPIIYDPNNPTSIDEHCRPAVAIATTTIGVVLLSPGVLLLLIARFIVRPKEKYNVPSRPRHMKRDGLPEAT